MTLVVQQPMISDRFNPHPLPKAIHHIGTPVVLADRHERRANPYRGSVG
ncbi:MAG: hypothetical protein LC632_04130 [Xanthomonadaceae bacterium]|nr:hypothetical protein [Xanthomonadaceae bacterium]